MHTAGADEAGAGAPEGGEEMEEEQEEEVMVLVQGVAKPFSEVTEVDQDLMSPDEYSRYAELYEEAMG